MAEVSRVVGVLDTRGAYAVNEGTVPSDQHREAASLCLAVAASNALLSSCSRCRLGALAAVFVGGSSFVGNVLIPMGAEVLAPRLYIEDGGGKGHSLKSEKEFRTPGLPFPALGLAPTLSGARPSALQASSPTRQTRLTCQRCSARPRTTSQEAQPAGAAVG